MASRASFRRKPEPRDVSFSATPIAIGALVSTGARAPMPSGGLRRNDEGEQARRLDANRSRKRRWDPVQK